MRIARNRRRCWRVLPAPAGGVGTGANPRWGDADDLPKHAALDIRTSGSSWLSAMNLGVRMMLIDSMDTS